MLQLVRLHVGFVHMVCEQRGQELCSLNDHNTKVLTYVLYFYIYFHFSAKLQKVGGTTVTLTVTVKTFSLTILLKMKWHTLNIYRRP